ncbi:hypothetical protein KAT80_00505 [Candidatus Pacearchaeota archaeon]|nr:hypothetical protein [Candidatus Pacearchaeota archaeon]
MDLEDKFYRNVEGIFFKKLGSYGFSQEEAEKIAPQLTDYVKASIHQNQSQHVPIKGLKREYLVYIDGKGTVTKSLPALSTTRSPSSIKPPITLNPNKILDYRPPLI